MGRHFPGHADHSGGSEACVLSEIRVNRVRESGPKHCTGAYSLTPDLGLSRMGRNDASRQSMGRGLRQNWL